MGVSLGMRFSFVNTSDKLPFLSHVFFSQGKTPSPRAAHACATVGNRGFVFGGRYRVSHSPAESCATKTQMQHPATLCFVVGVPNERPVLPEFGYVGVE